MRIGFVTCVDLGVSSLYALLECSDFVNVAFIATLPSDRAIQKVGRASLEPLAFKLSCPIFYVDHIDDLISYSLPSIDYLFIIGWSQVASNAVIDIPGIDCIGAHPTLLPIGRGRAPIPWTIIKGLSISGLSFFRISPMVDEGSIYSQLKIPIDIQNETSTTLYSKFNRLHFVGTKQLIKQLLSGDCAPTPQALPSSPSWPRRSPSDGCLSLELTVDQCKRLIRAQQPPYPLCYIDEDPMCYVYSYEGMFAPPLIPSYSSRLLNLLDGSLEVYCSI